MDKRVILEGDPKGVHLYAELRGGRLLLGAMAPSKFVAAAGQETVLRSTDLVVMGEQAVKILREFLAE